ncbi:MAG: hypothetical protein B6D37_02300 [Sphingobacteriales bacterium UTBCD1]|nr:MAG: hypothetical protein B6D37_02300 [Sphingobacteriales bacterium UTBCD1]
MSMKQLVPGRTKLLHSFFFTTIICCCVVSAWAQPDIGRSYINISKGNNGGTVEPGDTLEIRASFVVRSGTYDSCGYFDAVPAGTTYIPGTIRVLTNEGKIYKQFTDAYGDDAGYISGSNIRINLGYKTGSAPATAFKRGKVGNTYKPSFYNSACIMIASFRVKVNGAYGSNINITGGYMSYKNGLNPVVNLALNSKIIQVYPNYGICSNTVGTNAIGTESNGTFGSGKNKNRGTSGNVPAGYTYNIFDISSPQDYYYGITNNTSTKSNYTTSNTWSIPDNSSPTHRVFTLWDIIGDHTGAASPTAGNPATDTVNSTGGYMLVINSAYRIDSAFVQTITGLCPNTYYEISCWMRNICSRCGCDSNGVGAGGAGYIPTALKDSSGVHPSLSFQVDGVDYYTTGNLLYTGQWVKKGFTYLTGPAQTGFTLKYFNNAPGGGGNDWALDDISVATCLPTMQYSPSINPFVCMGNTLQIYDTVRSFFNNYTYFKWQRSTDHGGNWNDITTTVDTTLVFNGSSYEFLTKYTVPPAHTKMSDSADLYRVVVASTASNLSNANCLYTDATSIITLSVSNCGIPLGIDLLSFSGKLNNGNAELQWVTANEDEPVSFGIEKSLDGINFTTIATVKGYGNISANNFYRFTDPAGINEKVWYRIAVYDDKDHKKYSRTILLNAQATGFSLNNVISPFSNELNFEVVIPLSSRIDVALINLSGERVRIASFAANSGSNSLSISGTDNLPRGIYILQIKNQGEMINRKVMKK